MGEAEVALRLAIGRLYFLLLPILTVAWLGVTFAVQEPFPTLVMPGFGRSPEISELTTFERSVFLVGDDADDRSEVTSLEFSNLDFTQSQSLPLIDGIQRELPDLDPELQAWIHQRLAEIVPARCGETVEFRRETVRVDEEEAIVAIDPPLESHVIGALQCTD